MLAVIASFCFRRRRLVAGIWLVLLIGIGVAGSMQPETWLSNGKLEGADSQEAQDRLEKLFEGTGRGGFSQSTIVFYDKDGIRQHEQDITTYLDGLLTNKKLKVGSVTTPFADAAASRISKDGTTAYATIAFKPGGTRELQTLGPPVVKVTKELREKITVEFSGFPFQEVKFPPSEIFGLVAAVFILLVAFGSLVAAGLPIFTAIFGIGITSSLIMLVSQVLGMPEFTTQLAAMIGIGVGIDYALFIVTRFRDGRTRGLAPLDATVEAIATAGRAVMFAGITVVISLLGMFIMGMDFVNGLSVGASMGVAVMVAASLTLLPALLGSRIGRNIDRWKLPISKQHLDRETIWHRWSRFLQRHAWVATLGATALLVLLSIPTLSLRVGAADDGVSPSESTVRKSYDLLADKFGLGFVGPLLVVADGSPSVEQLAEASEAISNDPGVVEVVPSAAGLRALPPGSGGQIPPVLQVVPSTTPQDIATEELVDRLRDSVLPKLDSQEELQFHVGGITAANVDFAQIIGARLGYFIGAVLLLSFLLLMAVFRSILVPLKAVIMNLLSIGGAYGIIVAIFQWGWLQGLLGLHGTGPIEPWAPMMLFAIVFGLSMDYEVFLLSKVREEYDKSGDNSVAVVEGLASTARVITAAATIMVIVFLLFVLGDSRPIKLMGLGLSVAVFLDATVVRMVLVPATMQLLGDKNWWIPKWLDRILPDLDVEGHHALEHLHEHDARVAVAESASSSDES